MSVIFNKEKEILPLVQTVSNETGVPVALILGHMKQESAFNPRAYRAEPAIKDASIGLMQVLVKTAQGIDKGATKEKLYDPLYNIRIGTSYIAHNLSKYNNIPDAIAAYNAGVALKSNGRYVSRSGNDVQHYVDKVYNNYKSYQEWLGKGANAFEPSMIDPLTVGLFLASGLILVLVLRRRHGQSN